MVVNDLAVENYYAMERTTKIDGRFLYSNSDFTDNFQNIKTLACDKSYVSEILEAQRFNDSKPIKLSAKLLFRQYCARF